MCQKIAKWETKSQKLHLLYFGPLCGIPVCVHAGAAANILPRNACTTSPQHVNNTMILLLCNEDWPLHIFDATCVHGQG